jgi:hypothetical protein
MMKEVVHSPLAGDIAWLSRSVSCQGVLVMTLIGYCASTVAWWNIALDSCQVANPPSSFSPIVAGRNPFFFQLIVTLLGT